MFKRYLVALLPVATLWQPATGAAGAAARAAGGGAEGLAPRSIQSQHKATCAIGCFLLTTEITVRWLASPFGNAYTADRHPTLQSQLWRLLTIPHAGTSVDCACATPLISARYQGSGKQQYVLTCPPEGVCVRHGSLAQAKQQHFGRALWHPQEPFVPRAELM
jgi:hypothetical protein